MNRNNKQNHINKNQDNINKNEDNSKHIKKE